MRTLLLLAVLSAPPQDDAPRPVALPERAGDGLADELVRRVDPRSDGWNTEVWNERAGGVHKELAHLIEAPAAIAPDVLEPFVTPDFVCGPLVLDGESVFEDGALSVRRSEGDARPDVADEADLRRGAAGLARELRSLAAALGAPEGEVHAKFKLFEIEPLEAPDEGFVTRSLFQASRLGGGARQLGATWRCTWSLPGDGDSPRLRSIEVERAEAIDLAAVGGLFADATASVLGRNDVYAGQVLPGIHHWTGRLPGLLGTQIFGHHGLALGDANGDGLEDLYACDVGGLPNRLYMHRLDGTALEVGAEAGVDWLDLSTSALFVDLDGDGDQDLAVSTLARLLLHENDGEGRFALRASLRAVAEPYSLSAIDHDGDGDLDLYVCGYGAGSGEDGRAQRLGDSSVSPVPYHDANNGGNNALLSNEGEFRFTDVTAAVGLDHNNTRFSFAASWEDYDGDGDPDLYVANDFGRNNLYRNEDGRFRDVASEAGVEDIASGMSVAWGDHDRDGRMDLYVSNMFSSAGNRITYQRRFLDSASGEVLASVQRMARGNTLFANAGDGTFADVSETAGVTMGRWAWASDFADLNNDGWEDLVVTNGYFTNQDPVDL